MSSSETNDAAMMRRALEEAVRGRPSPNPHVGAVVEKDGRVIAVGHHERAGLAHAEVMALEQAGDAARGATLYVTFEPCNHHGRTPPCTEAILRAGIARVVVGARDPAPHVPGAMERLTAGGVRTDVGVLEAECRAITADFTKHITTGLPYVTLKAAVSLDGKLATREGDSKWITGEAARAFAHQLRAESDAVLVGVGTVLADDPELTVRAVKGENPLRVVLDTNLRTPPTAKVLNGGRCLVLHGPNADTARKKTLSAAGAECVSVTLDASEHVDIREALRLIGKRDVVRLLVEGGAMVHAAFIDAKAADAAAIFVAPLLIGGERAPGLGKAHGVDRVALAWRIDPVAIQTFGSDIVMTGPLRQGTD